MTGSHIVTSDDIKIYYTGKLQDFTARYVINNFVFSVTDKTSQSALRHLRWIMQKVCIYMCIICFFKTWLFHFLDK